MNKSRYPACPKCNQRFLKDMSRSPRRPLLLDCGHSICEGCANNMSRVQKSNLKCPTCEMVTGLSSSGVSGLLPDVYVSGIVHYNDTTRLGQGLGQMSAAMAGFKSSKREAESFASHNDEVTMCYDCCTRPAACNCFKCEWMFCDQCFQKVHSVSNALRSHKAHPVHQSAPIPEPSTKRPLMCDVHSKIIEYFCEDEQVLICSSCAIKGPHFGHTVMTLEEKNKLLTNEIEPATMAAKCVVDKMKDTEKALQRSVPNFDKEISTMNEEIRASFQWLYGILQIRESNLLKQVIENYKEASDAVVNLRQAVMEQRMNLQSAIVDGQKVLMGKDEIIDGAAVLDTLLNAKNLRCRVLSLEQNAPTVLFKTDTAIIDSLRNYGQLETTLHTGVQLAPCTESADELVADFIKKSGGASALYNELEADSAHLIPVEDTTDAESIASTHSATSTVTTRSATPSEPSQLDAALLAIANVSAGRPPRVAQLRADKNTQNRSSGLVHVQNIKSPCDFTVVRATSENARDSLNLSINNAAKRNTNPKAGLQTLKIGDAVIGLYETKWHRARIFSITKPDGDSVDVVGSPVGEESVTDTHVNLYFFDYGNYHDTTLEHVQVIPPRYLKPPDFAIHCCLANIAPKKGEWQLDVAQEFAKMVGDKPMYMQVCSEVNEVLQVDLCKPATDDVADDRPMSVRDTMVFLELASFVAKPAKSGFKTWQQESKFIHKEPKGIGSKFEALVSYYEDPYNIVLQETGKDASYLIQLMSDLDESCKTEMTRWNILCPKIGMPCACQYTDNSWYRAEVVGLPGKKQVEVEYIDFGNRLIVPVSKIRPLDKRFVVLPAQAMHCSLIHVAPLDEAGWSVKAKQLVKEKTEGQTLAVTVLDTTRDKLMIKLVVLENSRPAVHVNSLLVSQSLAISTGLCSTETLPLGSVGRPLRPTRGEKGHKMYGKQQGPKEGITRTQNVARMNADSTSERSSPRASLLKTPSASKTPKAQNEAKAAPREKSRDSSIVEVVVSKFYTPSLFYVQLADAHETGLDRLQAELKETGEATEPNVTEVKTSLCVIVKASDGVWYRGKVSEITSPDSFECEMIDFGHYETVKLSDARVMPKRFISQNCVAFKCSLADIMPAGDVKWTKTSCETCMQLLKNYKYYIAVKGNNVDGVLPVDLNLERDIPETALEPSRKEVFSLVGELVDNGLALPQRKKSKSGSPSSSSAQSLPAPAPIIAPIIRIEPKQPKPVVEASGISPKTSGKSPTVTTSAESRTESSITPHSPAKTATSSDVGKSVKESTPAASLKGNTTDESASNTDNETVDNEKTVKQVKGSGGVSSEAESSQSDVAPPQAVYLESSHFTDDTDEASETVLLPSRKFIYIDHPRPTTTSFVAKPMYVDNNGVVYAQLMDEESVENLTRLTDDMQAYYLQDSQYERPESWSIGQATAAYYEKDKLWCRTKVEMVRGNELQLLYIDYGNSEMVLADNVQADVEPFTKLPQFTVRFTLANIEPLNEYHGIWPENVLSFIQNQIVFFNVTVEIVEYDQDDIPFKANVYLADGDNENLADLLCEAGLAQQCDDIHSLTKRSNIIQQFLQSQSEGKLKRVGLHYTRLPEYGYLFPVTVTHVELPNIIHFQHTLQEVIDCDDKHHEMFKEINAHLQSLENISVQLNHYGSRAKILRSPREGMVCCAQFSIDMCWYRGLVVTVNVKKQRCLVMFVDYGNTQEVHFDLIKVLPQRFMNLPAQSICCHIAHLQPPPTGSWSEQSYVQMVAASANKTLIASITRLDPQIEADFYIDDKDKGVMRHVYDDILNENLAVAPNRGPVPSPKKENRGGPHLASYMLNRTRPATHSDSDDMNLVEREIAEAISEMTDDPQGTVSECETASEVATDSEIEDDRENLAEESDEFDDDIKTTAIPSESSETVVDRSESADKDTTLIGDDESEVEGVKDNSEVEVASEKSYDIKDGSGRTRSWSEMMDDDETEEREVEESGDAMEKKDVDLYSDLD